MYVCMNVCMYEFMVVCMYVCMHVYMYVCMYVCMFFLITCSVAEAIRTIKSTSISSELNLHFSDVNTRYV